MLSKAGKYYPTTDIFKVVGTTLPQGKFCCRLKVGSSMPVPLLLKGVVKASWPDHHGLALLYFLFCSLWPFAASLNQSSCWAALPQHCQPRLVEELVQDSGNPAESCKSPLHPTLCAFQGLINSGPKISSAVHRARQCFEPLAEACCRTSPPPGFSSTAGQPTLPCCPQVDVPLMVSYPKLG